MTMRPPLVIKNASSPWWKPGSTLTSTWILAFARMTAMILLLSSAPVFAGNSNVGTSGAAFLKIGPGARPVGMGEAFTGVADDIHSVYWNPAGLATLKQTELTGMHMQYFQSIQYEFAAFAQPTEYGTWALSIANIHTDNIDRRTEDSDAAIGQFSASDAAYWVSYGKRLTSALSLGANFKYIRESLDTSKAQAWAGDGGMLYETGWHDLKLGAALQNLGTHPQFINESDPLPLTLRLGGSVPYKNLLVASDILMPRDHQIGAALGTEYTRALSHDFAFSARAGYRTDSDVDGLKGVAAGGGLTFGRASIDFAWVPFGELGNSYRFGLHLKLGERDEPIAAPRLQKISARSKHETSGDPVLESLLSLK